jgi:hypothetical protein
MAAFNGLLATVWAPVDTFPITAILAIVYLVAGVVIAVARRAWAIRAAVGVAVLTGLLILLFVLSSASDVVDYVILIGVTAGAIAATWGLSRQR